MKRPTSPSGEYPVAKRPQGLECLECVGGVYVCSGASPVCSSCGAPAPQALVDTVRRYTGGESAA